MRAGKTYLKCGTKIQVTKQWLGKLKDLFDNNKLPCKKVTGTITHPFGMFGGYDFGAIAGIRIDKEYQNAFGEIGNLFEGDYKVIKEKI